MTGGRRLELAVAAAAWFGVCVLSPWWLSLATICVCVPVLVRAAYVIVTGGDGYTCP